MVKIAHGQHVEEMLMSLSVSLKGSDRPPYKFCLCQLHDAALLSTVCMSLSFWELLHQLSVIREHPTIHCPALSVPDVGDLGMPSFMCCVPATTAQDNSFLHGPHQDQLCKEGV